jgi:hypothetical protein
MNISGEEKPAHQEGGRSPERFGKPQKQVDGGKAVEKL